jgi:hypothetical protein
MAQSRRSTPIAYLIKVSRDAAINDRLAAIPPAERASFHATFWRIVEGAAMSR